MIIGNNFDHARNLFVSAKLKKLKFFKLFQPKDKPQFTLRVRAIKKSQYIEYDYKKIMWLADSPV